MSIIIGQFVHPAGGEDMSIVILAICEYHFIRSKIGCNIQVIIYRLQSYDFVRTGMTTSIKAKL